MEKSTMKPGGKAKNIIFEDATVNKPWKSSSTVPFLIKVMCVVPVSGCIRKNRFVKKYCKKLKDLTGTLIIGNLLVKNTAMGAINSKVQLDTINEYIEIGLKEGALIYRPKCSLPYKRFWFNPAFYIMYHKQTE